jgi:hypothetical protein
MRGGIAERGFRRSSERSEGEDKAMMAVVPRLRPRAACVKGRPWRPGLATVGRSRGMRGRPNDPLPDRVFEKRGTPKGASDSCDHEGPSNSRELSTAAQVAEESP